MLTVTETFEVLKNTQTERQTSNGNFMFRELIICHKSETKFGPKEAVLTCRVPKFLEETARMLRAGDRVKATVNITTSQSSTGKYFTNFELKSFTSPEGADIARSNTNFGDDIPF